MNFEDMDFSILSGDELYDYGDEFLNKGIVDDAIKCYKLAAEKGCSDALIQLAELYEIGHEGLTADFDESIKWYKLAAENGDTIAQQYLGEMYRNGNGVEDNFDEFLKWYKLAAEGGNREAIYTLGHLYYYGDEVEQSYEEAYYWFDKDGFRNLPYYICADMYFYVTKDYTNAFRLYHSALEEDGVDFAAFKIGEMYYYGLGTEQDYNKAFEFLKHYNGEFNEDFADEAPPVVHRMLGEMYKNGWGVEQNLEEAEKLFKAVEEAQNS